MECIFCGRETSGSIGGRNICPSCDYGINPDGSRITYRELVDETKRWKNRGLVDVDESDV